MLKNLLDKKLAQQIVIRTMKIIHCNINVMDKNGYIIGSGDLQRIGELHEGALLVLSQKRIVTITEDSMKSLHGAKPGINLPLQINDELIGVIGLTGDPNKLFQFGELVKMSAEMMMEQAQLINEITKNKRIHEDIVLNLIQYEDIPTYLKEWALRLGIDISTPRSVAIIDIKTGQLGVESAMDELNQLHNYLMKLEPSTLIAIKSLTRLIILIPALNSSGSWDQVKQQEMIKKIVDKTQHVSKLSIKASLGNFFPYEADGIAKSYQTALAALAIGKKRAPNKQIYYYSDYILPIILKTFDSSWQKSELTILISKLKHIDTSGILIKTLKTWFDNNLQSNETAKKLYIHRNTLEYRLKKISEITELDLKLFENQLLLYISLIINDE